MTVMNRARCQDARLALEDALHAIDVAQFEVAVGSASYSPERGEATFKVTVRVPGSQNDAFESDAKLLGLEGLKLGMEYKRAGHVYRVVGINLRARKYPIIVEQLDGARHGARFKVAQSVLAHHLKTGAIA